MNQGINAPTTTLNVILADMIHHEHRGELTAAFASLKTGAQAKVEAIGKGFLLEPLDPHGRVLVITWKGFDVGLLYHRKLGTVTLLPGEQSKVAPIKSPGDAWVLLPLLTMQHSVQVDGLSGRVVALEQERKQLRSQVASLELQSESQRSVIDDLESELEVTNKALDESRSVVEQFKRTGSAVVVRYKTRTVKVPYDPLSQKKKVTPSKSAAAKHKAPPKKKVKIPKKSVTRSKAPKRKTKSRR